VTYEIRTYDDSNAPQPLGPALCESLDELSRWVNKATYKITTRPGGSLTRAEYERLVELMADRGYDVRVEAGDDDGINGGQGATWLVPVAEGVEAA
jgi:hypothetical protein